VRRAICHTKKRKC